MLEQSLIKSNFVGKDGFIWWIGQIQQENAQGNQINGAGWGHRYKVRILGYDSPKSTTLKESDARWAQVMLPVTAGSGAANQSTTVAISPGDMVFGFFLDGAPDYNVPMILGVFGRSSFVSTGEYNRPFQPYTGYTSKISNDGAYILNNQSNENNVSSQKSPRAVSPQQAKSIGADERASFSAIGDVIKGASASASSTVEKMSTEIDNFVNKVQTITDNVSGAVGNVKARIDEEIAKITAKIQKISSGIVNSMVGKLYLKLAPVLNAGLKLLYRTVYNIVLAATANPSIAHLAGVAAQTAMVEPVKSIQKELSCIANTIISGLGSVISGMLESVANNVTNFVSCISDQVIGGLMNNIIGGIDSILTPLLGAVDKILMGFNVISSLRSNAEGLLAGVSGLSPCQIAPNYNGPTNKWVIGKGAKEEPQFSVQNILDTANAAQAVATSLINSGGQSIISDLVGSIGSFDFLNPNFSVPGFTSTISSCFGGKPSNCGGVKVKIFGSDGVGAVGKAIMGSIVGEGKSATGSVMGIDILNGGSGYDFPPFVEIVDDCKQGYGAVARAVIDYDKTSPTYKQVIDIYIVSEGENYPLNDPEETPESKPPYVINKINIIDGGLNYTKNDKVIYNKTEYKIQVGPNGEIFKVLSSNSALSDVDVEEIKELPELIIKSSTGYGAILKPQLKPRPEYQGEIKQVIDCVGLTPEEAASPTRKSKFTSPSTSETLFVSVINPGSGNKFYINGVERGSLTLARGKTYIFDVSNSSNATHIIGFVNSNNSALNSNYVVIYNGTSGTPGSFVSLTIKSTATESNIKYICTVHAAMGAGNITIVGESIGTTTSTTTQSTVVSASTSAQVITSASATPTTPTTTSTSTSTSTSTPTTTSTSTSTSTSTPTPSPTPPPSGGGGGGGGYGY